MKIQLPENIRLNRPEQSVLSVEVYPERFSLLLYNPEVAADYFYYPIPADHAADAFSQFQEVFFDNEFFALPFRNVFIINYETTFTFVPDLLFEEKDRDEYLRFLFTENTGRTLSNRLPKSDLAVVHTMPEERYVFFQRSFPGCRMLHYTAPVITHFQENNDLVNGNRMIIHNRKEGIDVFCFSRDHFLFANHFPCSQPEDAVYYALFVWRQLKFNQLKDYLYIMDTGDELAERLSDYVRKVAPALLNRAVPFETTALSLCE
ncbi:MAG: DUF3822 family protein [Dysgonamonadaceae bacterium]|jgi:hypothetical protein|nr:DUF3822 family protein [Dysgonamonadaceae bacterium]